MIKKNDAILIGIVFVLGLLVIFLINITKSEGSEVLITVDGQEYKTISLDKDITYTIEVGNGEWNTFTIKDGYVDMLDANCPDKLCVRHKNIHYNHETIVCLPNKVVLEIINGKENEIDGVVN